MKRIAIITLNDNNNYGNRLQNYAVEQTLRSLECDCETITNISNLKTIKYKIKHFLKSQCKPRYKRFISYNKNIKFSKCKIDNNQIIDEKKMKSLEEKYDYFVVGSDQVWNPTLKRFSVFELLPYIEKEKRVSFSASFGISELPEQFKPLFKEQLMQFKAISVRENEGKKIIEDLIERKDIEVLVDPTMLLTSAEWDKVIKKPKELKSEKYILNYFLGDLPEEWQVEINRIAKENNCEIINILDPNSPFYQTGPSEFLYLEKNAFIICTDSFHSCVFSIIYDKPFVVFDRKQNGMVSMNSRIDTLLTKFNLQNIRFTGKITPELLTCNYTEAKNILKKEKEKSINFLKKALDIEEGANNE